ncbi:MAG: peptidylprolyl isomerase [Candidatus Thiodiazotropha taylori]|nr:peptidyl-prolyl cis-trans isomerase [Candidatus Thiodiazotropha taylori]MCG7994644.1 peptidyl-prolyl cis-trans isomerase [Candidatus Thiodiazotropha taylori]MCW4243049.1 peptidylprolyl isomerase [Candidatus Thiodiazotropha taylori]
MKRIHKSLLLSLSLLFAFSAELLADPVKVLMKTSMGDITLSLDQEKAPKTVENFLQYVRDGFYDGTIYHRVIKDFMIQGGGFTADMKKKATRAPVENEAKNGLKNKKGSIAMARTSAPHSATAQFFINHKDNSFLDYPSRDGWGYAVFGEVTQGMDVVNAIAEQPTGVSNGMRDVPRSTITIDKVSIVE